MYQYFFHILMRNFTISIWIPKSPPTPAATCFFFGRPSPQLSSRRVAPIAAASPKPRENQHVGKALCRWWKIKRAKSWQRTKVVATTFLFPPSQLWKWISQQSHHFWMSIPRSIFQSSKTSSTLSCYISLISQQISQSFCMSSWCSQHGRSFSLGREAIDVLSSLQC